MDWKTLDWKGLLKQISPVIATALGGPLAGTAVSALSTVLLGKENGTETEIAQALSTATPDMILKLKQADNDFAAKMKELDIDLEKISAGDRDSARKREIEVKDKTPRNLAYLYTAGYFIMIFALFKFGVPEASRDLMNTLVGILSAAEIGIVTYYFGSSHGSDIKTSMMAGLEKRK